MLPPVNFENIVIQRIHDPLETTYMYAWHFSLAVCESGLWNSKKYPVTENAYVNECKLDKDSIHSPHAIVLDETFSLTRSFHWQFCIWCLNTRTHPHNSVLDSEFCYYSLIPVSNHCFITLNLFQFRIQWIDNMVFLCKIKHWKFAAWQFW